MSLHEKIIKNEEKEKDIIYLSYLKFVFNAIQHFSHSNTFTEMFSYYDIRNFSKPNCSKGLISFQNHINQILDKTSRKDEDLIESNYNYLYCPNNFLLNKESESENFKKYIINNEVKPAIV